MQRNAEIDLLRNRQKSSVMRLYTLSAICRASLVNASRRFWSVIALLSESTGKAALAEMLRAFQITTPERSVSSRFSVARTRRSTEVVAPVREMVSVLTDTISPLRTVSARSSPAAC